MRALKIGLVVVGVLASLLVCIGSAVAVWGFSGFRGEVCTHLGDRPAIVERTGRLTRCDERTDLAGGQGTSVFDLEGSLGKGRAFVTSETDPHGNVLVHGVRLVIDGGEVLLE
jgi:hypothetical protein